MSAEPADFEAKLNYRFSDQELLHRALTHSSLANETKAASGAALCDNEPDVMLLLLIDQEIFESVERTDPWRGTALELQQLLIQRR